MNPYLTRQCASAKIFFLFGVQDCFTADMRISWCVSINVLVLVRCQEEPVGHLKPLGSHRPPESAIAVLDDIPSPHEFFDNYVKPGKPVLFRGAAKRMPPYNLWTDDYLSKTFGNIRMDVEEGKKENRSLATFNFKLQDFISRYKTEDVYMVESLPKQMQEEYMIPSNLHCGGFTEVIQDAIMWFSSGGTKSVLHFDSVENINCLFSGSKKFIMIDKKYMSQAHIDRLDGSFSSVDVEKVDLYKYPGLGHLPWYNVSMQPGDCMYIPYMWIHQVHSFGSRNLAVNIWWAHFTFFNYTDCEENKYKDIDRIPISKFTFKPMEIQRQLILESVGRQPVSEDGWVQTFKKLATEYRLEPIPDNVTRQNFREIDSDKNGLVTAEEIFEIKSEDIEHLLSPGQSPEEKEDENEETEENINHERKDEL